MDDDKFLLLVDKPDGSRIVVSDIKEIPPPGGGVSTMPTGNLVWVDQVNGNDSSGLRGRFDKPFQTLTAAKNAAINADTICVDPGTYAERNLFKNGVDWHFYSGAKVIITTTENEGTPGSRVGPAIFDDSSLGTNGPVVCSVTGFGEFRRDVSGTSLEESVIVVTNAGSDISFKAKSVVGGVGLLAAIFVTDGKVSVDSDLLDLVWNPAEPIGHFAAVFWTNGELFVRANVISLHTASGSAIWVEAVTWTNGFLWVEANHILSVFDVDFNIGFPFYVFNGHANARVWINAQLIEGDPANLAAQVTGSKVYITAAKILGEVQATTTGEIWLNVQKLEGALACAGSGILHATIQTHISQDTNRPLIEWSGSGKGTVEVQDAITDTQHGLNFTGGTLRLLDTKIDATAGTSANPIVVAASGLTLQNVQLIAASGRDSIFASSAQTITKAGTIFANRPKNANITIAPLTEL